ncbi:MAG: tetratricopeptide repeat protein [Candidatus Omnitrophota bacterium]
MLTKKFCYLALGFLCLVVYYNALNGQFVSDDIDGILKNPDIGKPFLYWLQPANFLYSISYLIVGFKPFIFHLTSLFLHIANTFCVFILLGIFFGIEASLLGASLFAAHPVHVEAVSWISGCPYLMTSLFVFIAYFLYHRATAVGKAGKKIHPGYYFASLAVFFYYYYFSYAFYSVFPFFLVLSDVVFKRWRKAWIYWLPFFIIVALWLIRQKTAISGRIAFVAKDVSVQGGINWSNPVYNMVYSFFTHMGLLFWPAGLTLYHEPPVITAAMLRVEIVFYIIMLCVLPFLFKRAKPIFFGLCVFILFLAPTYSPVMVSWLVAERYLYFPSIFMSLLVAFFYEKLAKQKRHKAFILLAFSFLIALYAARTISRNEDWKTPARLWRSTVEISPNSPRSHNNMGDAFAGEGNDEAAIAEFKKSVEINPNYADAYHNLANMYHHAGNTRLAIENYSKAISINPNIAESHYNLGIIYLNQDKIEAACNEFQKALEIRPGDVNVSTALNFALSKKR